jgi:hypothetical protein
MDELLPTFNGNIIVKILKLDEISIKSRKSRLRRKKDINVDNILSNVSVKKPSRNNNTTTNNTNNNNTSSRADAKVINPYEDVNVEKRSNPIVEQSGDLLEEFDDFVPAPQQQDMFDFNQSDSNVFDKNINTTSSNAIDIDEKPTMGLSRSELAARREANVQEKVKEALEFKQELDENQRKEADELDAAKNKYDNTLTQWAFNNKEKRNVRTLLSTMHTVVWPECSWKPIGLGDVIESSQVKKVYRKAMLVVHPDRCSGLSGEVRFIAKRIFEAINEAYQEFLKKESV